MRKVILIGAVLCIAGCGPGARAVQRFLSPCPERPTGCEVDAMSLPSTPDGGK